MAGGLLSVIPHSPFFKASVGRADKAIDESCARRKIDAEQNRG